MNDDNECTNQYFDSLDTILTSLGGPIPSPDFFPIDQTIIDPDYPLSQCANRDKDG